MINSKLSHVALINPHSMLSLHHGKLPKVVSELFTTFNWGRGWGDKIVDQLSDNVPLTWH
jgi:hypothetical protein